MAKTTLEQWDETAANNSDTNSINIQEECAAGNLNNAIRENMAQTAAWLGDDTLASGTTTDLGSVPGRYVTVSGTTTITGLGTIKAGTIKYVTFSGALTLTHNATSLILPGAANIVTAAGDCAILVSEGSGNWRCVNYQRAEATSGTWSGQLTSTAGTITMGNSGGAWTKNGKLVSFTGYFDVSSVSSPTGALVLVSTGLPGAAADSNRNFSATTLNTFGQVAASNILFQARVVRNTADVKIVNLDLSTGLEGTNTAALVKANTAFILSGQFITA